MHRQTVQLEPLLLNNQHMNQSKNNVPIINQKPIHIAPVPFLIGMVGFSIPRTFTLRSILPTLSFWAKPKAKSQNPSFIKLPSPSKRVATVADIGWGSDKNIFSYPPSALTGNSPQGWRFFSLFKVSILQLWASPACRMTWEWGRN